MTEYDSRHRPNTLIPPLQFKNVARDIIAACEIRGRNIFDNLESVSVQLTSYALGTKAQWPFVVFPHFQVIGMVSNAITGAETLTISHVVQDEDRQAWENFTMQTAMSWMAEGHAYDEEVNNELYVEERHYDQPSFEEMTGQAMPPWNVTGVMPFIYDFRGFAPAYRKPAPLYVVSWQTAPADVDGVDRGA